eukprot:6201728-Pleurochrysis_carterae.AAC.1
MIFGIIPEWRDTDNKKKNGVMALLRSWTGEMMNCARIQMKTWVAAKNEHKASVQRRWDNRGKMNTAFQRWREGVRHEYEKQTEGEEDGEGRIERERRYGIKHWDRRVVGAVARARAHFLWATLWARPTSACHARSTARAVQSTAVPYSRGCSMLAEATLRELWPQSRLLLSTMQLDHGLEVVGSDTGAACARSVLRNRQRPLSIAAIGGSITAGSSFTTSTGSAAFLYHQKVLSALNFFFRAPQGHLFKNGGVPGTGPTYMEHCVHDHMPSKPDVILVGERLVFEAQ